jgi:acyl carrier protein phosphodiesterase
MNYLAHALLADFSPPLRAGSTTGDFFKGPLSAELPPDFATGVRLHRAIDVFADAHPAFRASRARFPKALRLWSGVIVDLYYDHLLARSWHEWHPESLPDFSRSVYRDIHQHRRFMDEPAQAACRLMAEEDWLTGYAQAEGLATTLLRMSRRVRRENPLAGAECHLGADPAGFAADCERFLRDAQAFAVDWLTRQASESTVPTVPGRPRRDSD